MLGSPKSDEKTDLHNLLFGESESFTIPQQKDLTGNVYKIKRYTPSFMEPNKNKTIEITHTNDIQKFLKLVLKIPWIKKWTKDLEFFRFSESKSGRGYQNLSPPLECRLMCEFKKGTEWYVVAILTCEKDNTPSFGLPEWIPIREKTENHEE